MQHPVHSCLATLALAALSAGCASNAHAPGPRALPGFKYGLGSGQTMASAVEIRTSSETEGGMLIHDWIAANYPGFAIRQQQLVEQRDHAYNMITIVGPGGQMQRVYFDISAFYRRLGGDRFPTPLS